MRTGVGNYYDAWATPVQQNGMMIEAIRREQADHPHHPIYTQLPRHFSLAGVSTTNQDFLGRTWESIGHCHSYAAGKSSFHGNPRKPISSMTVNQNVASGAFERLPEGFFGPPVVAAAGASHTASAPVLPAGGRTTLRGTAAWSDPEVKAAGGRDLTPEHTPRRVEPGAWATLCRADTNLEELPLSTQLAIDQTGPRGFCERGTRVPLVRPPSAPAASRRRPASVGSSGRMGRAAAPEHLPWNAGLSSCARGGPRQRRPGSVCSSRSRGSSQGWQPTARAAQNAARPPRLGVAKDVSLGFFSH